MRTARLVSLTAAATALAATAAAPAGAAATTVVAGDAEARRCSALSPADAGRRGVAAARYTPRHTGVVTVTLRAASGDWDLVVLDARSGHRHDASSWSGARERALAAATPGRPLLALACRRSGKTSRARIGFRLHPAGIPARTWPAQLVRVPLSGHDALERLEATGLDVTHNAGPHYADVVLYSAAERARLLAAGFTATTRVADLRAADTRALARRAARPLPSGQASYRTLAEYGEHLKRIASERPDIARMVTAGTTLEGRPIEGVELATNVNASDDGRPALLVLGLHHAREWPSGEMPMEFAYELAKLHGSDPRVTSLLDRVRVIAIPVVNADGFAVSRAAGPLPGDDNVFATLPLIATDSAAYKRKNCRPAVGSEDLPCITRPTIQGVDLNRNYGAYWGGVGSSADVTSQIYRGTAPYSEPESAAIWRLSSTRMITTVISHHTFTEPGVWLRQPGFCQTQGECTPEVDVVPDEAGMRALGDAMAEATGWRSALGWDIGEITGATEDWNYFAQGSYGYTPEQRGTNFHPNFEDAVVREYTGDEPGAAGGVREALLRAAEQAADPAHHAIVRGTAPPGRILRLGKSFATATSQPDLVVQDRLDFTLAVPAGGRFSWHVNPSTRPLAAGPESYVLMCEGPDGSVLERRDVTVARGATATVDLRCGGAGVPGSGPSASPDAPGTGARRARLSIATGAISAARLNRTRRVAIRLRARDGRLTAVGARLLRGRRTIARGRLPRLSGARTLRLRRVARARPGRHRLVITARQGEQRLSWSRAVRLRR